MASLIRMRQSDLFATRSRHFRRGNLWVQLYPRMKTFLLVPRQSSNHRRTTSWGVNIDAPRSKQLDNQGFDSVLTKSFLPFGNIFQKSLLYNIFIFTFKNEINHATISVHISLTQLYQVVEHLSLLHYRSIFIPGKSVKNVTK